MDNETIARRLEVLAAQIRAGDSRHVPRETAFRPTVGVYALVDPQNDRVMYVGQSLDIDYRFRQHLSLKRCDLGGKKYEWVHRLKTKGLLPRLVVLERCSAADLNRVEREKIHHFLAIGECELNRESYGLGNGSVVKSAGASRDDWFQLSRKYMIAVRLLNEIAGETERLCGRPARSRVRSIRAKLLGMAMDLKAAIKSKFGNDGELATAFKEEGGNS